MRIKISLSLVALLFCSATAEAQTPPSGAAPAAASPAPVSSPPPATAKKTPGGRNRGLMLRGGFGVDGCNNLQCVDVDPLLYLRMQALVRLHKYFATGLHLALNFVYRDDEPDENTEAFWSLFIGAEARGILPIGKKLELWLAFALGYGRWMWEYEDRSLNMDISAWANAFALAWGIGVDYHIRKNIALGVSVFHYRPFPEKYCYENGVDDCDDLSSDEKQLIATWWAVGFAFTYFIPF